METKNHITRLTPNENKWVKPSGKLFKCKGNNLFEASINNYGHEEWLNSNEEYFNDDNWHYGFIQAFKAKKHINRAYNLTFFTKRCLKNKIQLSLVGTCKDVIGIDENEAKDFFKSNPGILDIMNADLKAVNANYSLFNQLYKRSPRNIINVKFKYENLNFYKQEKIISMEDLPNNLVRGKLRFKLYEIEQ